MSDAPVPDATEVTDYAALILEKLTEIATAMAEMKADMKEMAATQAEIGHQLAMLRHDPDAPGEAIPLMRAQIDRLRGDVDRIKRRLDMVDETGLARN